ncbi:MAG: 50S ribosomal protein L22 [Chloroflexota bacterium]|nr:50S ribosomal protein L22 [Chloroflexota bacterium]
MEVWATAKYLRIGPHKARLVGRSIVGQDVEGALATLAFLPNRGAHFIAKVVKSAVANAENNYGLPPGNLYVSRISVDDGPRLKRLRAKSRGRPGWYKKRMAHITVVVDERES